MRAFFALEIDEALANRIDRWRANSLPPFASAVPWHNFHLTLAFLGEISRGQRDELCKLAAGAGVPPFELRLDSMGYWPRREISYLAPRAWPAGLDDLAGQLRRISNRLGLKSDRRQYRPHVTLSRRCAAEPPPPLVPPDFEISAGAFHLYESRRVKAGVRYEVIARWKL